MLEVIKDRSYHYKESGLDYVWLIGILQYKCKKCGEHYVEIPRINDLHLLIGKNIVCKKELLSGQEVRFLRKEIGMRAKKWLMHFRLLQKHIHDGRMINRKSDACHDKALRMVYVMNASELMEKVLSFDSHSILHSIAIKEAPKKMKKVNFTSAEWLTTPNAPIFGREVCVT